MKKLYYLIILTVILGLVLTGCLLSNVGQVPTTGQKGMPFPTAANLVALWHFDEDIGTIAHDSTENNDGTISGASWVDGNLGKALRFDGSADYVDCGDDASFNFVDNKFTVEAWINGDVFQAGYYDLIVFRGYNNWAFGVFHANRLMFGETGWTGSFSRQIYSDALSLTSGHWYHVAVVYDTAGKAADFYLDGVPVGVGKQSTDKPGINNSGIVTISYSNATGFDGIIDEVRIWDGALTAAQIDYSYADKILHVDDDWAEWPGAYYTIEEALAVADDGDTIIVEAGEYEENVLIDVDGLTLESTVIHGANIKGSLRIEADNVSVYGFEFTDPTPYWGETHSIFILEGAEDALIEGNLIDGLGTNNPPTVRVNGIMLNTYNNLVLVSADIVDNHIINVHMGIYAQGNTNLVATGNTIEGSTYCGIGIDSSAGTEILGNTISNSGDIGIEVFGENVVANRNNITDNADFGVWSIGPQVDATCNWWGDFSGPSGEGSGSGDAVSENVDFAPWLLDLDGEWPQST